MKIEKAVIVGCIKNGEEFLPQVIQNLEKLKGYFCKVAFIFIENDSRDQTKKIIREWGNKQDYFKLFSLDGLDEYEKNRTIRLEIARNAYINAIKQDDSLHQHDYMIVLDMDDRGAYPLDLDSVKSALSFLCENEVRAAVFSNQATKYYDLWALRHPQLCPFDFWHEVLAKSLKGVSDQDAFDQVYLKVPKCIPSDMPPIQVESAFGGLGIYKMQFVLNNKSCYVGHEFKYFVGEDVVFCKLQTCEHVSFNRGISALGGQMFILPYLLNSDQDTGFNPSSFRTIVIQR